MKNRSCVGIARGHSAALLLATAAGISPVPAASADTLTFVNTCGTGAWNTICSDGAGGFRSNWGLSGPNPSLLYPGPSDTAVLAGVVQLDANPTVAGVVVPSGATLTWENTSLNAGLLDNSGLIQSTTGFNRFFTGMATNQPAAQWNISGGNLYLTDGVVENDGTLTLSGGGGVRRNGSTIQANRLQNEGIVHVTSPGGGSPVSAVTIAGSPSGLWRTDAGALLTLDGVALEGTVVGDHHGDTAMTSGITLNTDASLATVAASNPWGWTSAQVDTAGHTLTNSGGLRLYTGFNKFLTGSAVNSPTGVWAVDEGALYLVPGGSGPTTLTNAGTFTVGAGALRRNGGQIADAVLANAGGGVVRATQPNALISGVKLSSAGGQWATAAGASCTYEGVSLGGQFVGNHAGTSAFTSSITLFADTTLSLQAGSANPWDWNSASIDTGAFTLTNTGGLRTVSGFNKFITGTMVNDAGATLQLSQGNLYLQPNAPTTITNNGEVVYTGAGWLLRNGGAIGDARFVNNGTVRSATSGAIVQGLTLTSNGGLWKTAAGATLDLSGVVFSGQFVGDHAGDATLSGSSTLAGNTTLTTAPTSVNPWEWSSAVIDTGAFTLTNAGQLITTTGFNKFLAGAAVNAPTGDWSCAAGTFYLNATGSGPVTLTNNGTLTLSNNSSIARNGGAQADGVLTNNALLRVTDGSSSLETLTLSNGAAGEIRLSTGASLRVPADWVMTAGRVEGSGTIAANGLIGVTNGGTFAPHLGAATNTLNCGSRFVQSAAGTLEIAVVSDGSTQTADRLALTNGTVGNAVATLGGTLRIVLPGGTSPPPIGGQDLVIVDAPGGRLGTFASVVEADPIPNYRYMVIYTPTQVFLRVIRRCGGADVGATGGDANFDGVLDNNDFIAFIDLFFQHSPDADVGIAGGQFGADGQWDNNDFISFIDLFFSGCH